MAVWRRMKSSASILMLLIVVLYIGYCTQELYDRVQKAQKLQRLKTYESEIDELTNTLQQYKKEAGNVQKSLKLLQEAFNEIVRTRRTELVSGR